ncbi:AAA family ATPase [Spongisporangium articulatum]|uniref:AAA family ATPase n=1 Tax=Spongisporangium articulatum TaxID=3362603 RepID=A0ABW8AQR1_9ACTN
MRAQPFDAPLTGAPRRVLVAGASGAGKTTLAVAVAAALDIPHVEIDALYHGPGWTPRASFAADVAGFSARPEWVTEWQYSTVRPLLAERADLLVWLDLPRRVVMRQVVRRTVRRRLRREVLWNGNREGPLWMFVTDDDHIVRWAWRTHARTAGRVEAVSRERPELPVVRLRSRREVRAWVQGPLSAAALARRTT